jgi:hypothetical protein
VALEEAGGTGVLCTGRRGRSFIVAVTVLALSWFGLGAGGLASRGGASPALRFHATGFFRTASADGRWWLVAPDGRPFYSSGVDHVSSNPDTDRTTGQCPYCQAVAAKYPNLNAWADTTVDRLQSWGFNTLGAWSDDQLDSKMPYTFLLNMASGNDWFSPAFEANAKAIAASQVGPRRDDPNLVGWYLDSELHWGPDWRESLPVLDDYLALPAGSPGRTVAEKYATDPGGFLFALATRYFQVTTSAIRAEDPNHLILGVKAVAQFTPRQLLEAARPYVDVFSVDDYQLLPPVTALIKATWGPYVEVDPTLSDFHRISGLPIMVAEYSFRAAGSGVPNSWPPIYPTLPNQDERAEAYAHYVSTLYSTPWIVGDHWFEYVDEPPGGRFDGENSNFGLVSTADVPWTTLVQRATELHAIEPDLLADPGARCLSWTRSGGHTHCAPRS